MGISIAHPAVGGRDVDGRGLVFGGTNEGNIFALDAETGGLLWEFQAGGTVRTNPMSYALDGKQYIVTAAGNGVFVFGLP